VPSSNEPATVVVRVYGIALPPFGGTTIGLPYLSRVISIAAMFLLS
jgi:hypothetical protein